jgi:hypothetical protein
MLNFISYRPAEGFFPAKKREIGEWHLMIERLLYRFTVLSN